MRYDAEVALLLQVIGHGVEQSAHVQHDGRPVVDQVGDIPADAVRNLVIRPVDPLDQRQIAFDDIVDAADVDGRFAQRHRHVWIDFGDHQRRLLDDDIGHVHRNTQGHEALVVRHGRLNDRDVHRHRAA